MNNGNQGNGNDGNNGNKTYFVRETAPETTDWELVKAKSDSKAAVKFVEENVEGTVEELAAVTVEVKKSSTATEVKTFTVTPIIEVEWKAEEVETPPPAP